MALRLTAEYINGALKPLEPLDLKEGTVVTRYIEEQDQKQRQVHSALETADRIRESAPAGHMGQPADRRGQELPALPLRAPEGRRVMPEVFAGTGYWIPATG